MDDTRCTAWFNNFSPVNSLIRHEIMSNILTIAMHYLITTKMWQAYSRLRLYWRNGLDYLYYIITINRNWLYLPLITDRAMRKYCCFTPIMIISHKVGCTPKAWITYKKIFFRGRKRNGYSSDNLVSTMTFFVYCSNRR